MRRSPTQTSLAHRRGDPRARMRRRLPIRRAVLPTPGPQPGGGGPCQALPGSWTSINMAESYFMPSPSPCSLLDRTPKRALRCQNIDRHGGTTNSETHPRRSMTRSKLMRDHFVLTPRGCFAPPQEDILVLCYGLRGSRKDPHNFQEYLLDKDTLVSVNGFPLWTVKQTLSTISEDNLEIEGTFSTTTEHRGDPLP